MDWRTEGGGRELVVGLSVELLHRAWKAYHCSLLKCCGGDADGRNPFCDGDALKNDQYYLHLKTGAAYRGWGTARSLSSARRDSSMLIRCRIALYNKSALLSR